MSIACAQSFDYDAAQRVVGLLRAGASHALDVFRVALPQRCELCTARTAGALLCDPCQSELPRVGASCPVCALPAANNAICGECLADRPPYAATVAALVYAFPVDRLIQRIKYGGSVALAHWAGATLGAAVLATLEPGARAAAHQIVALPLSAARQRERGFNQAGEIASRVAAITALPIVAPLARAPGGLPQAGLPWATRRKNVRGAFTVRGDVRGARLAIVDDVMTTGATLKEAARALRAAGAARVECWVVARTLRPADGSS